MKIIRFFAENLGYILFGTLCVMVAAWYLNQPLKLWFSLVLPMTVWIAGVVVVILMLIRREADAPSQLSALFFPTAVYWIILAIYTAGNRKLFGIVNLIFIVAIGSLGSIFRWTLTGNWPPRSKEEDE